MQLTLNLVDATSSKIKYKISKFPDGQQDVTILPPYFSGGDSASAVIVSRFNGFSDLELIVAATKALRNMNFDYIHLYIPYLLGARSDRKFVYGGTSYLVQVVAPIINSLNFKTVSSLDVHSDVAAACINNFSSSPSEALYEAVKEDFQDGNYLLVSPDAGSLKKIYKVAESYKYTDDVIVCSKYRDTEGNLSRTNVPLTQEQADKDLVIIDDICDGGRTFVNIAEAVKQQFPNRKGKTYLVITHAIFSAGLQALVPHFDGVYCTNSVRDFSELNATADGKRLDKEFKFKQINVF